jgi:hypothetical protein
VRPVRRGDPIVKPQDVANTDSDRLLTLVLVQRAGDLAFEKQAVHALLEAPNEQHAAVERLATAKRQASRPGPRCRERIGFALFAGVIALAREHMLSH